ncbi:MAG: rhodanese-like domain-containing protein [Candidatus Sericytochromatia bacterium]
MRVLSSLLPLLILSACGTQFPQMAQRAPLRSPLQAMRATTPRAVTTISVAEAHQWLADPNASWKLIDVRTPEEFAQGHLQEAALMNFYDADFREKLLNMDRNQPYIIYCRSGNRSGKALAMMRELGFRNAYDIQGGILAWQAAGFAVVK